MLRDEALEGDHTEFYQFSRGLAVEYDKTKKVFTRFDYLGKSMEDDAMFTVGLQGYHYVNFEKFLNLPIAEVEANGKAVLVSTSVRDVLEEYFSAMGKLDAKLENRLVIR